MIYNEIAPNCSIAPAKFRRNFETYNRFINKTSGYYFCYRKKSNELYVVRIKFVLLLDIDLWFLNGNPFNTENVLEYSFYEF